MVMNPEYYAEEVFQNERDRQRLLSYVNYKVTEEE